MITNIQNLNTELATLIEKLKAGEIAPVVASEINKASANLIRSCQIQINYSLARGERPEIAFVASK